MWICESCCSCLLPLGCQFSLPILLMVSSRFEPDMSDSIFLVCWSALCQVWAMVMSFSSVRSALVRWHLHNFDDLQVVIPWLQICSSVSVYLQYRQSCCNLVMYCSVLLSLVLLDEILILQMVCLFWLRNYYRGLWVLLQMFHQCFGACQISLEFLFLLSVVIMLSCKLLQWFLMQLRNIVKISSIWSNVAWLRMILFLVRIELEDLKWHCLCCFMSCFKWKRGITVAVGCF